MGGIWAPGTHRGPQEPQKAKSYMWDQGTACDFNGLYEVKECVYSSDTCPTVCVE